MDKTLKHLLGTVVQMRKDEEAPKDEQHTPLHGEPKQRAVVQPSHPVDLLLDGIQQTLEVVPIIFEFLKDGLVGANIVIDSFGLVLKDIGELLSKFCFEFGFAGARFVGFRSAPISSALGRC